MKHSTHTHTQPFKKKKKERKEQILSLVRVFFFHKQKTKGAKKRNKGVTYKKQIRQAKNIGYKQKKKKQKKMTFDTTDNNI